MPSLMLSIKRINRTMPDSNPSWTISSNIFKDKIKKSEQLIICF
jgi:hypothetical protein